MLFLRAFLRQNFAISSKNYHFAGGIFPSYFFVLTLFGSSWCLNSKINVIEVTICCFMNMQNLLDRIKLCIFTFRFEKNL